MEEINDQLWRSFEELATRYPHDEGVRITADLAWSGFVLIDLVESGVLPNPLHWQSPGLRITDEKTYCDCSYSWAEEPLPPV